MAAETPKASDPGASMFTLVAEPPKGAASADATRARTTACGTVPGMITITGLGASYSTAAANTSTAPAPSGAFTPPLVLVLPTLSTLNVTMLQALLFKKAGEVKLADQVAAAMAAKLTGWEGYTAQDKTNAVASANEAKARHYEYDQIYGALQAALLRLSEEQQAAAATAARVAAEGAAAAVLEPAGGGAAAGAPTPGGGGVEGGAGAPGGGGHPEPHPRRACRREARADPAAACPPPRARGGAGGVGPPAPGSATAAAATSAATRAAVAAAACCSSERRSSAACSAP